MLLLADHVILGDGKTVLDRAGVQIDGAGRLGAVGPAEELLGRFAGEEVQDLGDAAILPGLFDMHVHLGYYYSQPDREFYNDFMVAYYAAKQARLAARKTLMVNPITRDPVSHGGAFCFENGKIVEKLAYDTEDILIVEG